MKYLSQKDFDHLQELMEAVIAVYAQARETQENKNCVPGFDVESFLGEKELYSDSIIGCAASATHYQDRRKYDEDLAKSPDGEIIQLPNEMGGRSMNNKQLPGEKYGI